MIQKENETCWVDCWNSSIEESDIITDEMQAERWNNRADQFGRDFDEARQKKKTEEFFALLRKAGLQPSGARVLDIGCGNGFLSIPLAQAGAEVTSLDISSGMLNRLRETAEREDLQIHPMECSWWSADIDDLGFRNQFDLVIASMTPAIKDVETFDRMMACSKDYCYYSNFIRKDPWKIPRDLYQQIPELIPENNLFAAGFLYPFMYLYTRGYHPLIKLNQKTIQRNEDWFDVAEKAIDFIQFKKELPDEIKEKIRDYYRESSPDGKVISNIEKYTGLMVWSVK